MFVYRYIIDSIGALNVQMHKKFRNESWKMAEVDF
jgi:hypothetical protein